MITPSWVLRVFSYCAPSQIAAYPKNADDVEVQEQLMAGVFPFFRATVAKTCPVALREDLAIHFPELLSDEFKDLMGLGALSSCFAAACVGHTWLHAYIHCCVFSVGERMDGLLFEAFTDLQYLRC
jgi:hypothetical protein